MLVTGNITVTDINADTNAAFKNCVQYTRCVTHINDEHVERAENLDIIMSMYNFLEYSDIDADFSGSLYQFTRDDSPVNNAGNPINIAIQHLLNTKQVF